MATTEILPYAPAATANIDSQATYAAHTYLAEGLANGAIVPAQFFNKVLRQATFVAAGLANYLVNLGINVPDDGNLTSFISKLVEAQGALLNKSVAGGSDVTLNPATEANYPIIQLTGVLTANISVIVPASPTRSWIVKNKTTGNFSITLRTPSGSGVVLTSLQTAIVVSDGVDVDYAAHSLAVGQTWQNVVASRAINTFYTNTTGRPIAVNVLALLSAAGGNAFVEVDGLAVIGSANNWAGAPASSVLAIVPPGAAYRVNVSVGVGTLTQWVELR